MSSRRHLIAVNRAIRAAGLDERGIDAPLVELLRSLARQMDSAGPDGPTSRLVAAYLSATKDLTRATSRRAVVRRAPQVEAPSEKPILQAVKESDLETLRKEKRRAAG